MSSDISSSTTNSASITAAQCEEVRIALAEYYDGVLLSEDEKYEVSRVLFKILFCEVEYLMKCLITGDDNWWINDLYDVFVEPRFSKLRKPCIGSLHIGECLVCGVDLSALVLPSRDEFHNKIGNLIGTWDPRLQNLVDKYTQGY